MAIKMPPFASVFWRLHREVYLSHHLLGCSLSAFGYVRGNKRYDAQLLEDPENILTRS